jgi:predicted permease
MSSLMSGVKSVLPAITGNSVAFSAAGQAMAELGVAGCIGMACVEQSYLTPSMVSALSKTTFSILLPMFLGTSIIKTVHTYGLTWSSLVVPLLAIGQSFFLYGMTRHLLLPMFGIDFDTEDGRSTAVCCAWGNSGVVPLIFCESLFRPPFEPAENLAKSHAQISLYLLGWSPFFWSFGRSILVGDDDIGSKRHSDDVSIPKWETFVQSMKGLFPPPVVGVLVGLFLAASPLKGLFINSSERNAPLAVIYNTVQNFGRAANPLSLLVLTASLAIGAGRGSTPSSTADFKKGGPLLKEEEQGVGVLRRWACVSVARFILSPILMVGLLSVLQKGGIIGGHVERPMLWFVLILESCMPPAQNSVLMLQVANKGKKAGELAKFLCSVYATSMLPVVLILTLALRTFDLA